MANLQYAGSNGSTVSLNNSPSISLSKSGGDISNYRIDSVKAALYMSTTAYSRTYSVSVTVKNSSGVTVATGTASVKFNSSNYGGGTFTINLTKNGSFNPNNIGNMVVSCSVDGDKIFLKSAGVQQYVNIGYSLYTGCTPPRTVTAPATAAPGSGVTVKWSGAGEGDNVTIIGYRIYRAVDSPTASYPSLDEVDTSAASGTYTDRNVSSGHTYYYKIRTLADVSAYDSALSSATGGTYINSIPTAPRIQGGSSGRTYSQRPRMLVTLGNDADADTLTVSAPGFTPSRATAAPGSKIILRKNENMGAGSLAVTITNTDTRGSGASKSVTITKENPIWTDDPIQPGTTEIKAAHINELRQKFENLCDYYGISRPVWAQDVIAGETPSIYFPAHAEELQAQARRIANYVNNWDTVSGTNKIILPSMAVPAAPMAETINQLRYVITLL